MRLRKKPTGECRTCPEPVKPGRYYCRLCECKKARQYRVRKKEGKTRAYHHGNSADKTNSTPPEPPPGFDPRDLRNGMPYGSAHANDNEWQDGARPGNFHVRSFATGRRRAQA